MEDTVVKVTTAGSRLAILLPPDMVEELGWIKGTKVQLHVANKILTGQKLKQLEI